MKGTTRTSKDDTGTSLRIITPKNDDDINSSI